VAYRLARFLFGILLAFMSLTMGRGLSPLQKDILAVLEEFPAREDFPEEGLACRRGLTRDKFCNG
jgi:hypothetical protein